MPLAGTEGCRILQVASSTGQIACFTGGLAKAKAIWVVVEKIGHVDSCCNPTNRGEKYVIYGCSRIY